MSRQSGSVGGRRSVPAAELGEPLGTLRGGSLAWRTIHGSTRLESSIVSVGPDGPSATTIPELLR